MDFSGAGDGGGGSLNHHSHNLNQSDSSCSNTSGNGSSGVALFGHGGAASSVTSSRVRPASELHSESSSPLLKLARFDQNPNPNSSSNTNSNNNHSSSNNGFLMMPSPGFLENSNSNLNPNLVGFSHGEFCVNGSMAASANSANLLSAAPALLSATPLASAQPKFYSNSLELGDRYNPYLLSNAAAAATAHLARAHPAAASLLAGHSRFPFTADQWAEFTQQTYIFKHFTAGVTPPAALLLPIINSVALMSRLGAASLLTAGGFSMGLRGSVDPEPGRCRRTDGKKWRCAREVVPDQKYCERHMHRGRHRARAKQQAQQQQQQQQQQAQQQQQVSNPSISANDVLNHTSNHPPKPTNLVMANSNGANPNCGLVANHSQLAACRESQLNFSLGAASSANTEVTNRSDSTTTQMLYSDPTGLRRLLETSPHLADLLKSNAAMATSNTAITSQTNQTTATTKLFNNQILQSTATTANQHHQQSGFPFNCISSVGLNRNSSSNHNSTDNLALRQFVDKSPPNTAAAATIPWLEQLGEDSRRSPSLPLTLSTTAKFGGRDGSESTTGLSMAINNSGAAKASRGWLPLAWADSSVGGPLAEVLNNANNNSTANYSSSNGDHHHCLNLIEESWDQNPTSAKESHSPSLASPTGVLQMKTFGSCSDSSSSASSPRSALKLDSAPPALAS